jgi:hypothetical protein
VHGGVMTKDCTFMCIDSVFIYERQLRPCGAEAIIYRVVYRGCMHLYTNVTPHALLPTIKEETQRERITWIHRECRKRCTGAETGTRRKTCGDHANMLKTKVEMKLQ